MNILRLTFLSAVCALPVLGAGEPPNWPQFRGPGGMAVADGFPAPVHFSAQSNVVWKAALPSGHSSPSLWGDRIFLTGLNEGKLETLCLNRRDGTVRWRRAAPALKLEPTHRIASPACPTPAVVEGQMFVRTEKHLYCFGGKAAASPGLP